MKIGLIVYSYTGNTLSVAEKLLSTLISQSFDCQLQKIKAVDENPNVKHPELLIIPDTDDFDVLVFAAPVRAFMTAPIMKMYLQQLPSLLNKDCYVFVTHHFPIAWLGGKQTVSAMAKMISHKQGTVKQSHVVDWSNKKKDQQIDRLVTHICQQIIERN